MSSVRKIPVCVLTLCICATAGYGAVYINEFMASSSTNGLVDPAEPGEYPDWIELYNDSASPVNIGGWYLTDDIANPNQFQVPSGIVPANGFLLLYADNEPLQGAAHLGFKLSATGEAVGFSSNGVDLIDSISFGAQNQDESYGRFPDGAATWQIMTNATPGAINVVGFAGEVADTKFSIDRGFYTNAFQVAITSATVDATIYYTTDFSEPATNSGTLYTNAITITNTTCLRAAAFKAGWKPTDIDTHTYIFFNDVINQPSNPPGWPSVWHDTILYGSDALYVMDPAVTGSYSWDELTNSLLSLPSISIVTDMTNLFDDTTGIYKNPNLQGMVREKPCSVEWISSDGGPEFAINCGLRLQGAWARVEERKKSFRLMFKSMYGPSKLEFPMFDWDEDAVSSFDTIVLRSNSQGDRTLQIKDEFARRSAILMGRPESHGTFAHLYINGLYWGLYNPVERPMSDFCAGYLGGNKEEWDAHNGDGSVKGLDGNTIAWTNMYDLIGAGLADNASYQQIQGNNENRTPNPSYPHYLDVPNYIDYIIYNFWAGMRDWAKGPYNFYAGRHRVVDSTGYKWFIWDAENSFNLTNVTFTNDMPVDVHAELTNNIEYSVLFGDQAHRHMFNNGVLTPDRLVSRFTQLVHKVEAAMIVEEARWELTTVSDFNNDVNAKTNNYLPNRTATVIGYFRNAGIYPSLDAPVFYIDASYQHGGSFTNGAMLSMSASNTIYYTLDGTDPREYGTGQAVGTLYTNPVPLNMTVQARARAFVSTSEWSALNEAIYTLDTPSPLRITEIMYHPDDPRAGTPETNYTTADFEFIELKNTGGSTIGLAGIEFIDGIRFDFIESANNTLAANDHVVLVRNFNAFTNRYTNWAGINIAGTYHGRSYNPVGSLSDAGENIRLVDGLGRRIHNFDYEDDWYPATDGEGYSLTIIDPAGSTNNWDTRLGWRHSAYINGSPGADDSGSVLYAPGTIVINEALTHQDTEPPGDWIELYNTSITSIDISDWYISDRPLNLTKFQIPAVTILPAGGYVVFTESAHFGTNILGTNGFALSEHGEGIYLSAGSGGALAEPAYREFDDFGAADNDITFGRYIKTDGNADFTAMETATTNAVNSNPLIGPVVIGEILYNPTNTQHEFLELVNISGSPVDLYDAANPSNTWKVTGISFTFPTNISISNEVVLLVRDTISPAAFRAANSVSNEVQIFNYVGALDNDKDTITVKKPGTPDEIGVPYIDVDKVKYNDSAPWPVEADGYGYSLDRINAAGYGNDSINWTTNGFGGTPGVPTTVPTNPVIFVSPGTMNVSTPEDVNASNQTFDIRNMGTDTLVYTIAETNSWLAVAPTNDMSTGSGDIQTHFITFSTTSLTVGTYNAAITISSTNAANSPVTLNLNLDVTVSNNAVPVADAGTNQTVYIQAVVTLDGSGSFDPDIKPFPLTYAWSRISGPVVTIDNETSTNATFTPMVAGNYIFQLLVDDGADTDTDSVTVTVLFANTIPYMESFESYFNGFQLAGTNSWYAGSPSAAVVVTNDYTNTYAGILPISGNHALVLDVDGSVSNILKQTESYTNVWMDMMVEWMPSLQTPNIDTNVQFAIYVDSNGQMCVWNDVGASNAWTVLTETDMGSNEWGRLTVEIDYTRAPIGFRIYTNGTPVTNAAAWFNCADAGRTYFSSIEFYGDSLYDDLVVADYDPFSGLIMWLRGYYPNTNDYTNAGNSDTDGDGMAAADEYNAGTVPTDPGSIFRIVDLEPDAGGHRVLWLSVTGRYYSVYKSTNLLGAGWAPLTNNFQGNPSGTNFIINDTSTNPAAFYLIKTQLP